MKKDFAILAFVILIAGFLISFCTSRGETTDKMEGNVTEAKDDLYLAKDEYKADRTLNLIETEDRNAAFKNRLEEARERINKERKEAKAHYEMKIGELEQENKELLNRMFYYKEGGTENWTKFKVKFNHDMD